MAVGNEFPHAATVATSTAGGTGPRLAEPDAALLVSDTERARAVSNFGSGPFSVII